MTITVKGLTLGEGAPKTIVPLMAPKLEGLLADARTAVAAGADMLEWRADFFWGVGDPAATSHALQALSAALPRTPVLFTLRSVGQGGQMTLRQEAYAACLRAAASSGASLVDIELDQAEAFVRSLCTDVRDLGAVPVVSHHDFEGMPTRGEIELLVGRMLALGAGIPKIAFTARDELEAIDFMATCAHIRRSLPGTPFIALAMGREGRITRLAGEAFGSVATFCSLGQASAPGQVSLERAKAAVVALHRALA